MTKTKKVAAIGLALVFSLTGLAGGKSYSNVSFAQGEETSYKDLLLGYIKEDANYKESEDYKDSNDALKLVYVLAMDTAKSLVEDQNSTEEQFKEIYEQIRKAKSEIADKTNPIMEKAKYRVGLEIQIYETKNALETIGRYDYNKKYYDDLKLEYNYAKKLVADDKTSNYEFLKQAKDLKNAKDTFIKENNRKAYIIRLEDAIALNQKQAAAAKDLLTNYPKTVSKVKDKLEKILRDSENLVKESQKLLTELKK